MLGGGSGLLIPNERKFEMNATSVVTKTQAGLSFGGHAIKTIQRDSQTWMSATEIGRALEYANPEKAVANLFSARADEFTSMMTKVFKVATAGGKQAIRFFSLRGAHLLAMFARTDKAKAFRVWVLDILDREVADLRAKAADRAALDPLTQESVAGLCRRTDAMCAWWRKFGSAIQTLSPRMHAAVNESFMFAQAEATTIQKDLGLLSIRNYMDGYPWLGTFTDHAIYREQYAAKVGAA